MACDYPIGIFNLFSFLFFWSRAYCELSSDTDHVFLIFSYELYNNVDIKCAPRASEYHFSGSNLLSYSFLSNNENTIYKTNEYLWIVCYIWLVYFLYFADHHIPYCETIFNKIHIGIIWFINLILLTLSCCVVSYYCFYGCTFTFSFPER